MIANESDGGHHFIPGLRLGQGGHHIGELINKFGTLGRPTRLVEDVCKFCQTISNVVNQKMLLVHKIFTPNGVHYRLGKGIFITCLSLLKPVFRIRLGQRKLMKVQNLIHNALVGPFTAKHVGNFKNVKLIFLVGFYQQLFQHIGFQKHQFPFITDAIGRIDVETIKITADNPLTEGMERRNMSGWQQAELFFQVRISGFIEFFR